MDSISEHSRSQENLLKNDDLIDNLILFKKGSKESFWKIIGDKRVSRLIRLNVSKCASRFKLRKNDIEDITSEIISNLYGRIIEFDVDKSFDFEHKIKSFFQFLKLVLLGERERALKYIKGEVSRDGSKYHSLKKNVGFQENFESDEIRETLDKSYSEKEKSFQNKKISYIFRKVLLSSFQGSKRFEFVRSFASICENNVNLADFFKTEESKIFEKTSYSRDVVNFLYCFRKFFAERTDMPMEVKTLGIYCDRNSVSITIFSNSSMKMNWEIDCFCQKDLDTVEGKISDLIRIHNFTFIVVNDEESTNLSLVERYFHKRKIPYEKLNIYEFEPSIQNISQVISKLGSIKKARSWLLCMIKETQLKIVKTTL